MNKMTRLFLTLKGITAVGLTGLGMVCLSKLDGMADILMAFFCIYMAFFTSAALHHTGR